MKLDANDFEIFGLPVRFAQERSELDARWKALQASTHPDRFASEGAVAQRAAMQWAVRVNEAYRRLKDPLARGAYLCELNGVPVDAQNNTAMPPAFLMEQMEWREALEAAHDAASVEQLKRTIDEARRRRLGELADTIDVRRDWRAAAQQVRALMFVVRLQDEIDRRLEALEN